MRRIGTLFLLLVLLLIGMSLWQPESLRTLVSRWDALRTRALPEGVAAQPQKLHKCRRAGMVSYSAEPCTRDAVEEEMNGGTVTTLHMPTTSATPAPAASLPTARDLLGNKNEPTLQDLATEKASNP
jgi:hypothetical protein